MWGSRGRRFRAPPAGEQQPTSQTRVRPPAHRFRRARRTRGSQRAGNRFKFSLLYPTFQAPARKRPLNFRPLRQFRARPKRLCRVTFRTAELCELLHRQARDCRKWRFCFHFLPPVSGRHSLKRRSGTNRVRNRRLSPRMAVFPGFCRLAAGRFPHRHRRNRGLVRPRNWLVETGLAGRLCAGNSGGTPA